MPNQCFMSRESVKLIWMQARNDVTNGCLYCKNFEQCNKLYGIMIECKAKSLLNFNKVVKNWEVMRREKNNHFKIKPRDLLSFFNFSQLHNWVKNVRKC